jgi:hypothetical protein
MAQSGPASRAERTADFDLGCVKTHASVNLVERYSLMNAMFFNFRNYRSFVMQERNNFLPAPVAGTFSHSQDPKQTFEPIEIIFRTLRLCTRCDQILRASWPFIEGPPPWSLAKPEIFEPRRASRLDRFRYGICLMPVQSAEPLYDRP